MRRVTITAQPVWGDPYAWDNPAALDGDATADVCVVGLGGSGLAAVGALLAGGNAHTHGSGSIGMRHL